VTSFSNGSSVRSSPLKRSSKGLRRKSKPKRTAEEVIAHQEFVMAAREQRVCAVTGKSGPFDPHHVVEQQWLKREGLPVDDRRNALRLSPDVHANHTTGVKQVPQRCLTDENIEYVFEVMGVRAKDYLDRKYDGTDPRVERASEIVDAEWEKERGGTAD
jgi:hypothetical protein